MRLREILTERAADVDIILKQIKAGGYQSPTGFKPLETFRQLEDYLLLQFNVKNIGQGSFAYVLQSPGGKDYIFKVGRESADPFWEFAKVAPKYFPKNSLFPDIKYLGSLPQDTDETNTQVNFAFIEFLKTSPKTLDQMARNKDLNVYDFYDLTYDIFSGSGDGHFEYFCETFKVSENDLIELMDVVKELGRWDGHHKNAGWRKNGELVFFDPVW